MNSAASVRDCMEDKDEYGVHWELPGHLLDLGDTCCEVCGGSALSTGMVLCEKAEDKCLSGRHFHCFDEPIDKEPDGDWYCEACTSQGLIAEHSGPNEQGTQQAGGSTAGARAAQPLKPAKPPTAAAKAKGPRRLDRLAQGKGLPSHRPAVPIKPASGSRITGEVAKAGVSKASLVKGPSAGALSGSSLQRHGSMKGGEAGADARPGQRDSAHSGSLMRSDSARGEGLVRRDSGSAAAKASALAAHAAKDSGRAPVKRTDLKRPAGPLTVRPGSGPANQPAPPAAKRPAAAGAQSDALSSLLGAMQQPAAPASSQSSADAEEAAEAGEQSQGVVSKRELQLRNRMKDRETQHAQHATERPFEQTAQQSMQRPPAWTGVLLAKAPDPHARKETKLETVALEVAAHALLDKPFAQEAAALLPAMLKMHDRCSIREDLGLYDDAQLYQAAALTLSAQRSSGSRAIQGSQQLREICRMLWQKQQAGRVELGEGGQGMWLALVPRSGDGSLNSCWGLFVAPKAQPAHSSSATTRPGCLLRETSAKPLRRIKWQDCGRADQRADLCEMGPGPIYSAPVPPSHLASIAMADAASNGQTQAGKRPADAPASGQPHKQAKLGESDSDVQQSRSGADTETCSSMLAERTVSDQSKAECQAGAGAAPQAAAGKRQKVADAWADFTAEVRASAPQNKPSAQPALALAQPSNSAPGAGDPSGSSLRPSRESDGAMPEAQPPWNAHLAHQPQQQASQEAVWRPQGAYAPWKKPLRGLTYSIPGWPPDVEPVCKLPDALLQQANRLRHKLLRLGASWHRLPYPHVRVLCFLEELTKQGWEHAERVGCCLVDFLEHPVRFYWGLTFLDSCIKLQREPPDNDPQIKELFPAGVFVVTDAATLASSPGSLPRLLALLGRGQRACLRKGLWQLRISTPELAKLEDTAPQVAAQLREAMEVPSEPTREGSADTDEAPQTAEAARERSTDLSGAAAEAPAATRLQPVKSADASGEPVAAADALADDEEQPVHAHGLDARLESQSETALMDALRTSSSTAQQSSGGDQQHEQEPDDALEETAAAVHEAPQQAEGPQPTQMPTHAAHAATNGFGAELQSAEQRPGSEAGRPRGPSRPPPLVSLLADFEVSSGRGANPEAQLEPQLKRDALKVAYVRRWDCRHVILMSADVALHTPQCSIRTGSVAAVLQLVERLVAAHEQRRRKHKREQQQPGAPSKHAK